MAIAGVQRTYHMVQTNWMSIKERTAAKVMQVTVIDTNLSFENRPILMNWVIYVGKLDLSANWMQYNFD